MQKYSQKCEFFKENQKRVENHVENQKRLKLRLIVINSVSRSHF